MTQEVASAMFVIHEVAVVRESIQGGHRAQHRLSRTAAPCGHWHPRAGCNHSVTLPARSAEDIGKA
jgi:hypothetical protein